MNNPVSWFVVADGHRARVFRRIGTGTVEPALDHDFAAPNPLDHQVGSDRPGRTHSSAGTARSSLEETDRHRQRKREHLESLAAELDDGALRDKYAQLYLIAPPQALGDLRGCLGRHARARLAGESAHDVTQDSLSSLVRRFDELVIESAGRRA